MTKNIVNSTFKSYSILVDLVTEGNNDTYHVNCAHRTCHQFYGRDSCYLCIHCSKREYDNAKLERTKAEQERTRKEQELHQLKAIALKEQDTLSEKRLQTLVDDFIRMKTLTVGKYVR
jgi:NADH:ubiquinone oxidoreductase subunit F (NADH-binding)